MNIVIKIIFIILLILFALGSIGEKDKQAKQNYLFATIIFAILLVLGIKFW